MDIISGPSVVDYPERPCVGIRVVTPFRGMFAVRDRLMASLYAWLDERGVQGGTTFFRLHEVDMDGPMDVEVGVLTEGPLDGDDRVRPGVLPAGRYATMVYVNHGRRANGALLDWIAAEGLTLDRDGDRFACRYEAYLTDPRAERMKTRWQIELGFLLVDGGR